MTGIDDPNTYSAEAIVNSVNFTNSSTEAIVTSFNTTITKAYRTKAVLTMLSA